MIEAINEIGKYSIKQDKKELIDVLRDDPSNKDTEGILFINLKRNDVGFEYIGIETEEFSKDKLGKYLYKKGSPNGLDVTPISMITDLEKTFLKVKMLPWFKNYNQIGLDEETNFLVYIGKCIRAKKEDIFDDLKSKHNKEYNIISLKIDDKYIGEYEIFQTILKEKAKKNFYSKYGKISKSNNKFCSICSSKKEVYGFVDTYKFYTVDKPGFVSSGFRQKDAWKNYPVCFDCAIYLEAGKKYLKENLDFNFYGFNYTLIPKFVDVIEEDIKHDCLKIMKNWKDPKFRKNEINQLTSDESEILEKLSDEKNYLNLDFMFYDAPKASVFNILLYIKSILPSDLKRLFDAKQEIDNINIFEDCMDPIFKNGKKIGEKPLEFNFGIVRNFFPKISNNRTFNRYFLDVVNKIFTRKPIDYEFLISFIMRKTRDAFVNGYNTKLPILKGFMLINFLKKLDILQTTTMTENILQYETFSDVASDSIKAMDEKINKFFNEFEDSFDSNTKKAVFLEGVLTQYLLNIQYQERGAAPFRIKLKGLNLDERQIKKLLPEIQNKLEEYGKNYYKSLESIISKYFVASGTNWNMSNNEISFYFTLGMNLSYLFKTKKEGDDNNE